VWPCPGHPASHLHTCWAAASPKCPSCLPHAKGSALFPADPGSLSPSLLWDQSDTARAAVVFLRRRITRVIYHHVIYHQPRILLRVKGGEPLIIKPGQQA
jgi:hypothetical protein